MFIQIFVDNINIHERSHKLKYHVNENTQKCSNCFTRLVFKWFYNLIRITRRLYVPFQMRISARQTPETNTFRDENVLHIKILITIRFVPKRIHLSTAECKWYWPALVMAQCFLTNINYTSGLNHPTAICKRKGRRFAHNRATSRTLTRTAGIRRATIHIRYRINKVFNVTFTTPFI